MAHGDSLLACGGRSGKLLTSRAAGKTLGNWECLCRLFERRHLRGKPICSSLTLSRRWRRWLKRAAGVAAALALIWKTGSQKTELKKCGGVDQFVCCDRSNNS